MVFDRDHIDRLGIAGFVLMVINVAFFHKCVREHFRTMTDYQLQILSLRVCMVIPIYGILMWFCLIVPRLSAIFEALAVFCEGYCIYCYFALIVLYCGGKDTVIRLIKESTHTRPCYYSCQKNTPEGCYNAINALLIQFVVLRPIFSLLYGLAQMTDRGGELFRVLYVISLVAAMIGLLRIYHVLSEHAHEMDATAKIVFIKVLIIVLAVEDIIVNTLFASGVIHIVHRYGDYNEEEREVRLYAFITLVEFVFAAILAVRYFHPDRIGTTGDGKLAEVDTSRLSYKHFLSDFLSFRYVFNMPPGFGKLQELATANSRDLEMSGSATY